MRNVFTSRLANILALFIPLTEKSTSLRLFSYRPASSEAVFCF